MIFWVGFGGRGQGAVGRRGRLGQGAVGRRGGRGQGGGRQRRRGQGQWGRRGQWGWRGWQRRVWVNFKISKISKFQKWAAPATLIFSFFSYPDFFG